MTIFNKLRENKARKLVEEKRELMEGQLAQKSMLFYVVFIASLVYILWRLFFTLPIRFGWASIIAGVTLWFCESATVIETFGHFNNVRKVKIPHMPVISDDMYPEVDVMIATHNEDTELLYKTLNGCKYMDYPDKSKVRIHLCDDNNRPEMRELAESMGVYYYGVEGNKHAKAGNLNYALPLTHAPLIAIFDADMIPTSDFLMETVPYFFLREMIENEDGTWRKRTEEDGECEEKELGYVQTQQSFYNPDPLQSNLYMEGSTPNEQDYFYRSVNVARMHTESAAFAGSNTVFSRKALEQVGGFATHSITEDFATSIEILGEGYRTIALAKELAHGLSPEDVKSFIKQRQRWSRGAAQGIMTKRFWFSKMPLKSKWNFFTAYCYWWTFVRRFVFLLCPILYGVFHIQVADVTFQQLMIVWLPYYLVYNTGLKIMSGRTTSALWSDRIDTIQFPYMIKPIIAGTLMIPQNKFVVTAKNKTAGRNSNIELALPHIILAVLSAFTILVCVREIFAFRNSGGYIVIFWAAYNLFALLSAVVYYAGRTNYRTYERVPAKVPITIFFNGQEIYGRTTNISEGGMAVALDFPEYLPFDSNIKVEALYKNYKAEMQVSVRQVQQKEEKWIYSFIINEIAEGDRNEFLQIIYDRNHMFPRVIDTGVMKDLTRMYRGLTSKTHRGERRLARMELRTDMETVEKYKVRVQNFNYRHLLLKSSAALPKELTLLFPNGVKVKCIKDTETSLFETGVLYEVENWEEMAKNHDFQVALHSIMYERINNTFEQVKDEDFVFYV